MTDLFDINLIQGLIFVLGFVFVIIEMFAPGFGFPGILGAILLVVGVVLTANSLFEVFVLIIIILAVLGFAITIILRSARSGKLSKTVVLSTSMTKEEGYIGTEDLNYFLGKEGVALTTLRPAGTVDFNGVRLDVVTEGTFLPKGTEIEVVKVEGRKIVVHKLKKVESTLNN